MARIAYGTGTDNVKALKFDKPIEHFEYKYDLTEWLLNEEQPENGIVVENHRITITKFKPNVWLIKSNYSGLNQESYLEKFYNVEWKINGITENSSLFSYYTYNPYGDTRTTYNAVGIVISPINSSNSLFSMGYPWDMNIPNGYFKSVSGWNNYGYNANGTFKLYNFGCYNGNFNQVALALFTNNDTDENGYITLETPIVLSLTNISEEAIDPTTVEGFKATLGTINVYDKPKTFSNTFIDYSIANTGTSEYNNVYYYSENNTFPALTGANVYFKCDGGNWPNKYDKLRYPYPTDLNEKIDEGFPVKFVFTQYDKDENGFWNSLYNKMSTTEITDGYWGSFLFTDSNVPKMKLIFNPKKGVHVGGSSIENMQNAVLDNCFDGCHNLSEATLVRKGDENVFNTLNEVFRNCTNLSTLKFESQKSDGSASTEPWRVGELSGTFAACGKLTEWPTNIIISNTQYDNGVANDYCAQIQYAFESSGLETIGSGEEFNVGAAIQSFRNCPNLVTVNSVLNMRYIHPDYAYQVDNMFLNTKIETISLKNVNHNSWNFDGVTTDRSSRYIGDCSSFNQSSVNYLFDNLYDLTSNALEENILKRKPTIARFNSWIKNGSATINSDTKVTFSGNGNITINNASAGNFFKFTVSNLNGTLTLTGGNESKTITENGSYYVYLTGTTCTLSSTANAVIDYITTWDGAVSTVTLSSLYCPSAWDDETTGRYISNEMLRIAESRGWLVFVGGVRKPYVPTTGYEVIVNVNNTNLTYSGSTTFNVKLNKTVDGVTTTTDITSTATLTTGGSITVNQNNGTITGNNSTNYATTGTIKASYTPEGETSAVESTIVTINVAAKPEYSLTVNANPTSIASDGSSTLSAVYNTIIEGQTASTQSVTATYEITSGGAYATINGNVLNGNNTTTSNQSVVVKGTYNSVTGSTTVTVQAQAIVYDFRVTFSTDPEDSDFEREIHVGDYVQAYAYRKTNNGNWVDVTDSVDWESNNSLVASVGDTAYVDKGKIHGESVNENNVTITAYDTTSGKNDWVQVKVVPVQVYDISVSPTTKSIDYQQQSFNVTVSSTGQGWSVDTLPSFVSSVSPASGSEGSTTVTVTCNQNTSSSSRSNTLTFNGNESGSASVSITQSGYNPTPTYRYELKILDSNNNELGYEDITEGNSFNAFAWLYTYNGSTFISSGNVTDDCVWTSDDDSIASVGNTVYDKGEVTGESVGYTNINASYTIDDSTITDYFTINVQEKTHTFTITPTTVTLSSGETETETFVCKYDESVVDNDDCTWSVSTDIQPYVTLVNGVLTLTGAPSDNDVTGTITAQYNDKSAECDVTIEHYEEPVIHATAITIEVSSVEDIPAAGGSVDWHDATYTVTAHYSNGDTRDVTNESIITSNTVSASSKGTTVSGPNIVGQLTISADYLTLTDDDTIDVSQQANEVEESDVLVVKTNEQTSTTYSCGTTVYDITVNPSSATVDSEAGYVSVAVTGTKTTPYTATTTTSWDIESTPWTAYTSTASGYGETTTTHDSTSTTNSDSITESANVELDSYEVNIITAATTSEIYYNQNDSYNQRAAWVRYRVVESPYDTATFTLTQEGKSGPASRDVTFTVNDNILENDSNHGPNGRLKIVTMEFNCSCYDGDNPWNASSTWATSEGFPAATNIRYPFDGYWTDTVPNSFVIQIPYGVSAITFNIELTNIQGVDENDNTRDGADYRDTVTVDLTDEQTTAVLNLPTIVWQDTNQ